MLYHRYFIEEVMKLKHYFKLLLFLFSIGLFFLSMFSLLNIYNLNSFNKVILLNNTSEKLTYISDNLNNIKNLSFNNGETIVVKVSSNNFSFFLKDSKGKIHESKNFFIDFKNENNKPIIISISKKLNNKLDFLLE